MKKIKYLIMFLTLSFAAFYIIKPVHAVTIGDNFFGSIHLEMQMTDTYGIHYEVEQYDPLDTYVQIRNGKPYFFGSTYDLVDNFYMYYDSNFAVFNFDIIYDQSDKIYYNKLGVTYEMNLNSYFVFDSIGVLIIRSDYIVDSIAGFSALDSFGAIYQRYYGFDPDYYDGYDKGFNDGFGASYDIGFNDGFADGRDQAREFYYNAAKEEYGYYHNGIWITATQWASIEYERGWDESASAGYGINILGAITEAATFTDHVLSANLGGGFNLYQLFIIPIVFGLMFMLIKMARGG